MKRIPYFVIILVLFVLGCGGSSTGSSGSGTVIIQGGITSAVQTATQTFDSSVGDVNVTNGSGQFVGVLPKGLLINNGDPFCVIPAGVPLLSSVSLGARSEGDVFVNGIQTGVHITNKVDGTILGGAVFDKPLVLPKSGTFTVDMIGPFTAVSGTSKLNIKNGFHFILATSATGENSMPIKIQGVMPTNGSDVSNGFVIQIQTVLAFAGRSFTLKIQHANGTLQATRTSSAQGWAGFDKPFSTGNGIIPATGVDDVTIAIQTP